ncbi:uncharacterized protein B0T15DRAFT_174004 [Chaetomium strumarium]|uniref:Apple domain-containing protein n=1 Tax=Chaetomium strumarium TaxID=1170767 RepID=A0AAJ0GWE4_9PEZI|nr:hypothetical protein B0T15DRAFT_174004 [Chaetomium strumarium]
MFSGEIQIVERAKVHRRQNKAVCPGGNGTTIGTFQDFTVLCNTNLGGDVLDRLDAFDFKACVDLCSSFHPKCEAATFHDASSRCALKANLRPEEQRPSRSSDSAIAEFPGATSNCLTLGGAQQTLGTSFTTMCGFIIAGSDLTQNFAPTFQDCLGQCASTSGCAALSFDPSQDLGFKNCYLKTAVANSSAIAADQRTDSAIVAAAAPQPPGSSSQVTSSSASLVVPPAPILPTTDPGVSILTSPSLPPAITPGAGSGAVFFTPPAGSTITESARPATSTSTFVPAPDSSTLAISGLPTTPSSSLAAGSFPSFFPGPSTTPVTSAESAPGATLQEQGDSPPSMAWVAAPVVGSVAAIALIAVSFVMVRRRRRGSGSEKSCPSTRFAAWLPAAWSSSPRNERGASNRRKTGMGNFSEVESGRRSVDMRGSMRSSVVGFMTGRPMGMERLEDIEEGGSTGDAIAHRKESAPAAEGDGERAELRSSLNGLRQNRWS